MLLRVTFNDLNVTRSNIYHNSLFSIILDFKVLNKLRLRKPLFMFIIFFELYITCFSTFELKMP